MTALSAILLLSKEWKNFGASSSVSSVVVTSGRSSVLVRVVLTPS